MPNKPRSGLSSLSSDSHCCPPTAPNMIESHSLAAIKVSSGRGEPVSS